MVAGDTQRPSHVKRPRAACVVVHASCSPHSLRQRRCFMHLALSSLLPHREGAGCSNDFLSCCGNALPTAQPRFESSHHPCIHAVAAAEPLASSDSWVHQAAQTGQTDIHSRAVSTRLHGARSAIRRYGTGSSLALGRAWHGDFRQFLRLRCLESSMGAAFTDSGGSVVLLPTKCPGNA
jgi:hypothetical protein